MPNSFSARPSRTITISSSAPIQYTRAPLRCARPRRESRRSARVSFKKADFRHLQSPVADAVEVIRKHGETLLKDLARPPPRLG